MIVVPGAVHLAQLAGRVLCTVNIACRLSMPTLGWCLMIALLLKVVTVGLIIKQAKLYNNMHARLKTLSGNVPIMFCTQGLLPCWTNKHSVSMLHGVKVSCM